MNEDILIWLQRKAQEGPGVDWSAFGDVRAVYNGDLVLFNYTAKAQFAGRWNDFEQINRGLILNWRTGEIVARPFDKFFNWLEGGRMSRGHIVTVTEKVDGSLGILYRDNGEFKIATRGAFDSEQATWATKFLSTNYDLSRLPVEYTLLFEIIYPDNRIVVDYGRTEALFLLAVRNRYTGNYLSFPDVRWLADWYGFPLPRIYDFNNVTDIIAAAKTLPATHEGWVVEFSHGQRFKFKGDRYFELHRIVANATFNRVLEAVQQGTYESLISNVPDEFMEAIRRWKEEIDTMIGSVRNRTIEVFNRAPKGSRKEFALWVRVNAPSLASYLFLMLDGKDITPAILRREFE